MTHPPSTAPGNRATRWLEQHARTAILLRTAALPTLSRSEARSYFGGLPRLPSSLQWPTGVPTEEGHLSFTFMAQIDLAELPAVPASLLPRTGVLYFFVNLHDDWSGPGDTRVLYHAGSLEECVECIPPAVETLDPRQRNDRWLWLEAGEVQPYPRPRYAIEPLAFTSYRSHAGWADQPRDFELEDFDSEYLRLQFQALAAVLGPAREVPDPWKFEVDDPDWPCTWAVIEHGLRAIYAQIECRLQREFPDAERVAAPIASFIARSAYWLGLARPQPCTQVPDVASRASFRDDWHQWSALFRQKWAARIGREDRTEIDEALASLDPARALKEAVRLSCAQCLEQAVPERIAEKYWRAVECDAGWHHLAGREPRFDRLSVPLNQMLRHAEAIQGTPLERESQQLLLQIYESQLRELWPVDQIGADVMQFWIEPQDLAAARFDNVVVTVDRT